MWRQRLCPSEELLHILRERGITRVIVVGLKASLAVVSTCQFLVDAGLLLYVIRECVADDSPERCSAALDHVLPQLADVLAFDDFKEQVGNEVMMDMFCEVKRSATSCGVRGTLRT